VAGRTAFVPEGHYYATLLDVQRLPDDAEQMVLVLKLKITRAREPVGRRLVGRLVEVEVALTGDGAPFEGRVDHDRLARWAAWITSHGWFIATA